MIILLSWIRVFIPNLAQKHGCPIFFLFSNFLAPLRDLTNTVRDVYFFVRGRIIFGDVFLLIPNVAQFSFAREKTDSQTDKYTNKQHLKQDCQAKTEVSTKKEIKSVGTQLAAFFFPP